MLYLFFLLNIYVLYYAETLSCIGSLLFFFVISIILLLIGIKNQTLQINVFNKVETISLLSLILWLKLEKLITLFEINIFNKIFNNILNTNYNFLTKSYINQNKDFFYKKNKLNIFEELNNYKKLITF